MTGNRLWSRLRFTDKLLVVTLMPLWFVCLMLHVELAATDSLRVPALIIGGVKSADDYPVVREILAGSEERVAASGIKTGDELMSVNGRDLRGYTGLRPGTVAFGELGHDEPVTGIFRRAGIVFEADYPFNQFPIPWWWPTLFAVSFGTIGLVILLSAPASPTARAIFPGFVTLALTWLIFPGKSEAQAMLSSIVYALSMVFAGPLLLRAILLLPENTATKRQWVYASVWFFSLMALASSSAFMGVPFSAAIGQIAHLALIVLIYLAILVVLARNYIKADKIGRRQLRWVIFGFYLAFVPAMLITAIAILFPSQFNLYTLSSVGMPIIPVMFLIAIAKYNLFDIDRMIGGTVSYSILVVLCAVLAESVVEPMVAIAGARFGYDANYVQIAFVAILAAALIPLQRRWRPYVDRIFFAEGKAAEEAVETLIQELESHDDAEPQEWISKLARDLAKIFNFDGWAAYQHVQSDAARVFGNSRELPAELAGALWQKYERKIRPDTEPIGGRDNYLCVPIRPAGKLEWLLVLGPKRSGDIYTTTDNGLIASVAHIIAGEIAEHALAS